MLSKLGQAFLVTDTSTNGVYALAWSMLQARSLKGPSEADLMADLSTESASAVTCLTRSTRATPSA